MASLKITQVRSTIGARWKQRQSLRTLGLRRIRHSVIREDNLQTRGLIAVVRHLVEVEPAAGDSTPVDVEGRLSDD
ncbi:50S ribosomal protein L30 [Mycobacterium lepromatosis]|uniref:Large ribosomal subunit protein uL30 n=1 Tax=Mycobacterium lepromatosis TaxID=480418 RepID=A0A0F4EQJ6_9MYCO|nr:50S ribosomal protein L30 [Mycobacterium lepromatosis]KJX74867.1 50S ribosomal protein L30 [Mycobacterium lepromatosis]UKN42674.1 50S ribosomal protein L30 [Mycobacterium lepromatosis]